MKSIEARLQRAERAVIPNNKQAVFATVERRGGVLGVVLPDTGVWLSVAEAKVSPKCRNVIAWDKEEGFVLWRSKLTLADIAALAAVEEGK